MKKYTITKSKESNYVYFQIAKNATRTIINYLNKNTKVDFGFPLYLNKDAGYNKPYESEYDDYFKFTIVRNPWDRFLSFYQDKVRNNLQQLSQNDQEIFSDLTFKDSVFKLTTKDLEQCDLHYRLQTKMFPIDNIDFIGKFENLQEDFGIVCNKIGIPHQKFPQKNKSKHKHYTEYYDDETKEIVAEKYAKDIECFGYEFGK